LSQEDALGNEPNSSFWGRDVIQANLISDFVAELDVAFMGNPGC
jgi:hypothetical protein